MSNFVTIDRAHAAALMPELTFTIDWGDMARLLAEQTSDQQAEFFTAFFESTTDAQLAFIGSKRIFDAGDPRAEVARFYRDLAEHIEGGSK